MVQSRTNRWVRFWLLTGVIMIFVQIIVGGITRLTGSGLSITRWDIVTGTVPPLNQESWQVELEKYRQTPQYQQINKGMELSEFKYIYFWEYIHRLWARLMGLVFIIPFAFFIAKGWLSKELIRRLIIVVALAAIVASVGWIMVASGLVNRPWVSPYKLTLHLGLAILTYGFLFWVMLREMHKSWIRKTVVPNLRKLTIIITILISIQIIFGGLMSGMKAALFYPTFPDMHGYFIPDVLLQSENWTLESFTNYDTNMFAIAFVQFAHRMLAYIITFAVILLFGRSLLRPLNFHMKTGIFMLVGMVALQVSIGIVTLISSIGVIPVKLGVLHQAVAIFLLTTSLYTNYVFSHRPVPISME